MFVVGEKERRYTITKAGLQELDQLSQQIQNRRNTVIGPLMKLIHETLQSSDE